MRIKTVCAPLRIAYIFDDEVNALLVDGWDLKNVHTASGEDGEVFLIAHLERWDGND